MHAGMERSSGIQPLNKPKQKRGYFHNGSTKFTEEQRIEAFWSKVDKKAPDSCWEWKGNRSPKGYGGFWDGTVTMHAHRYSLQLKLGRILLTDEHALHTCDNRGCVNPAHIYLGTNDDNIRDKVRRDRCCRNGPGANRTKCETHPKAKLTNKQVVEIKERLKTERGCDIAKDYPVSEQIISMIKRNLIWRGLE